MITTYKDHPMYSREILFRDTLMQKWKSIIYGASLKKFMKALRCGKKRCSNNEINCSKFFFIIFNSQLISL